MADSKFNDFQRDALQEMGNIGAGSAATALSQLLGKDIKISVPAIAMVPIEKMAESAGETQGVVAAVYMRIFGEIQARSLLIFPQDKVFLLLDLLMHRKLGTTGEFGETEQSAIKEIGNILISAYLNAIAKFIGLNSVPSVPALAVDMADAIFETISAELAEAGPEAMLIENEMTETLTNLRSKLFIIPDRDSMRKILEALNNTMKGA
ncbi:MAG: chemotaxis protein CheC [Spirochaetia bacterium]|nr:chemotaxis protein CheC [Spirochaetia bacterium]